MPTVTIQIPEGRAPLLREYLRWELDTHGEDLHMREEDREYEIKSQLHWLQGVVKALDAVGWENGNPTELTADRDVLHATLVFAHEVECSRLSDDDGWSRERYEGIGWLAETLERLEPEAAVA